MADCYYAEILRQKRAQDDTMPFLSQWERLGEGDSLRARLRRQAMRLLRSARKDKMIEILSQESDLFLKSATKVVIARKALLFEAISELD